MNVRDRLLAFLEDLRKEAAGDALCLNQLDKVEGRLCGMDELKEPYDSSKDHLMCECGHPYHRHFDGYEDDAHVGCKYCGCGEFQLAKD